MREVGSGKQRERSRVRETVLEAACKKQDASSRVLEAGCWKQGLGSRVREVASGK